MLKLPDYDPDGVDAEAALNGNVPTIDDEALRDAVWARVQMARNVQRPHTLELVQGMATDVAGLHGDRRFGDDPALVGEGQTPRPTHASELLDTALLRGLVHDRCAAETLSQARRLGNEPDDLGGERRGAAHETCEP